MRRGLATLQRRQTKTLEVTSALRFPLVGSSHAATPFNLASRDETVIRFRLERKPSGNFLDAPSTPYHYHWTTLIGRNSEKSCSYCGNPAPPFAIAFCIPLKYKDLDLVQFGPRVANHVPPAQVHLYWCPDTQSSHDER